MRKPALLCITRHVLGLPRKAILAMKRKNGESLWVAVDHGLIEPAPGH